MLIKDSLPRDKLYKIPWLFCSGIIMLFSLFNTELSAMVLLCGILTNILIIWEVRKVQPILIMSIFFLSYLLYLIPYYFADYLISGHSKYYTRSLYDKALRIHVIYLSAIYFFIEHNFNSGGFLIRDLVKSRDNKLIFFILYTLMIIILATVKGESVLTSDSYATYIDNLEKQGGSLEYFYILFICAYYFTRSQILRNTLLLLVVYYIYSTVTKGYRIQLVQVVFLTFILFFDGKFKSRYIIVFSFLGFIISEILGIMKTVGNVSIEEFFKLYDNSSGIIITNQTDVFYSSVVFLGVLRDGFMALPDRIWSTVGFFWNCIAPSSYVWKEARLPQFASGYTTLGGGGLISVYFFVWFGYLGPLGIAAILSKFLNGVFRDHKQNLYKISAIMLLSTFPRWFAYDPANFFFRLPIYLVVCYFLLITFHNLFKFKTKAIETYIDS